MRFQLLLLCNRVVVVVVAQHTRMQGFFVLFLAFSFGFMVFALKLLLDDVGFAFDLLTDPTLINLCGVLVEVISALHPEPSFVLLELIEWLTVPSQQLLFHLFFPAEELYQLPFRFLLLLLLPRIGQLLGNIRVYVKFRPILLFQQRLLILLFPIGLPRLQLIHAFGLCNVDS